MYLLYFWSLIDSKAWLVSADPGQGLDGWGGVFLCRVLLWALAWKTNLKVSWSDTVRFLSLIGNNRSLSLC